jgi:hypothetical protein
MNPSLGYQLYQAGRTMSRAEILTDDARRGHLAAALARPSQRLTGRLTRRLTGRSRSTTQMIEDLGVAAGQGAH